MPMKPILVALVCLAFLQGVSTGRTAVALALPYPEPLMTTEETKSPSFDFENPSKRNARCQWYRSKLGQYSDVINKAAKEERIPPELLMTLVLNELADIGPEDVEQDQAIAWTLGDFDKYKLDSRAGYIGLGRLITGRPVSEWSLGIAQISPSKALRYNALAVPPQIRTNPELTEFYVAFSLLNRTVNIQAAAKVIKGILKDIERQQKGLWISQFIRPGVRFSADNPYDSMYPPPSKGVSAMNTMRRRNLTEMVIAVYNTDNLLTEDRPYRVPDARRGNYAQSGFANAGLHALNSREIVEDLEKTNFCGMPIAKWEPIGQTVPSPVFKPPLLDGLRLDGCLYWASQCGKPAADRFCITRQKGYKGAATWDIELYVPRTKVIGDGRICETGKNNPNCGAFTFIECR